MMQKYDAVIIGAGPIGLFQVFQLGLLGLKAAVIDSLPYMGGQCRELYAEKPIYDVPGVAKLSGAQLIDNLLQQIAPFAADFYLAEQVTSWHKDDTQFVVETAKGLRIAADAIVIAAGVGMFRHVPLKLAGIEVLEGTSVHYAMVDRQHFKGQHVVVLGGGDVALREAVALLPICASVTHVHKTSRFRAEAELSEAFQAAVGEGKIKSLIAQSTAFKATDGQIERLTVTDNQGIEHTLDCDAVLALFGQSPDLAVMADWPLARDHQQLLVDTANFETSVAGIYAVGDINSYPAKRKLLVTGFHEATMAAFAIKQRQQPDKKVPLQYTTTSPLLHQRLGV